jgi:photosystem II stability/assembly factor-like uncharacterized protein
MPKVNPSEIVQQSHKRFYVQDGGPRPANPALYGGMDAQYLIISGVTKDMGSIDPIRVPDPLRVGSYRNVGESRSPADLPTATVTMLEKRGVLPQAFRDQRCPINFYEASGACKDLSDFANGWSDYVKVYSLGRVTSVDGGDRGAWEDDGQIENAFDISFQDIYDIGSIYFGSYAASEVSREIVDIVYGGGFDCGLCGPANDGTKWIYAVARSSGSGSPGLPAELIYTVDGGLTWTEAAITGIGASEDPAAIDIVGDRLIVLTRTAGGATTSGYYWATINRNTGAPGSFTKVVSGFVTGAPANDLLVLSSRDIFFVADGGYIYKSTDITSGVSVISAAASTTQNLSRIAGEDETLYAVGANSTVLISQDRGDTWAASVGTVPTTTATIQAVAVLDKYRAWVGSSSGRVFATIDGGETWREKVIASAAAVQDIQFATDEVGYISYTVAGPTGGLLATWNGGADWASSSGGPRLQNVPTTDRVNRVAFPQGADAFAAANYLALAALGGDGTDGLIALGAAASR